MSEIKRLIFKPGDIVRRNFGPKFTGVVVIGNDDGKRVLVRDRPDGPSSAYDVDELDLVWTVEQHAALTKPDASLLRVAEAARALRFVHNSSCDVYDFDPCLTLGSSKPCNCGMNVLTSALAALHAPGEKKKFTITDIAPDEFKRLDNADKAPGERKEKA